MASSSSATSCSIVSSPALSWSPRLHKRFIFLCSAVLYEPSGGIYSQRSRSQRREIGSLLTKIAPNLLSRHDLMVNYCFCLCSIHKVDFKEAGTWKANENKTNENRIKWIQFKDETHSVFGACNTFLKSWDRDNKRPVKIWNAYLFGIFDWWRVMIWWFGIKGASMKGSGIHKHGWRDVHHFVKNFVGQQF